MFARTEVVRRLFRTYACLLLRTRAESAVLMFGFVLQPAVTGTGRVVLCVIVLVAALSVVAIVSPLVLVTVACVDILAYSIAPIVALTFVLAEAVAVVVVGAGSRRRLSSSWRGSGPLREGAGCLCNGCCNDWHQHGGIAFDDGDVAVLLVEGE